MLGFGDEEFADEWYVGACRPGAHAEPGVYRGGFDRHSVMYTCGARRSMLSAGDRFHAAVLYGARPDRRDRLADLDGNGAAEPIATNVDHTWALRSGGFGFYDFHWLAGPFYGTRATLYGDVNGDGSDDAVAINADGAYVAVSNGTTLVFAGRWATTPFSRTANPARPSDDGVHVFLGEVTGDELADLVSVDRSGNIWVQASTGTAFVRPYRDGFWGLTQEAMPFQIDLADLDGDRKADLIETSVDRFAVHASTGRSFRNAVYAFPRDGMPRIDRGLAFGDVDGDRGADAIIVGYDHLTVLRKLTDRDVVTAERWTAAPLWGTRATLVADINGDERVDVVAVNDDADWVAVSNGNEFLPFGLPWTSGPFYSLP